MTDSLKCLQQNEYINNLFYYQATGNLAFICNLVQSVFPFSRLFRWSWALNLNGIRIFLLDTFLNVLEIRRY